MIKEPDVLRVELEGQLVGRVVFTLKALCAFEYDTDWLGSGFSISPFYLPLKPGLFIAKRDPFDGLFGVFNDSLPDGWGNLLLNRLLQSKGIDPDEISAITRLSILGNSGMGALSYFPETSLGESHPGLSLDEIAIEADRILNDQPSEKLDELFQDGGSSGGARPKVLIRKDGQDWLVKFRSSADHQDIGEIEYRYSLLAKKSGIQMPETRLFEGKYFGVKRFDREEGRRIHMLSASGLLHASHRFPSLDYKDLLQATLALTHDHEEVLKLYRQMVFNVMIGNKDDHSKNFSFLFKAGKWILSPAYDILPSSGFNNQHTTTINGQGNPSKEDILAVAGQVGIGDRVALRIFDELKTMNEEPN